MKQISAHFVINCYFGKSLSSTTTWDDRISKHRVKYKNNCLNFTFRYCVFSEEHRTARRPTMFLYGGDSCLFSIPRRGGICSLNIYKGHTGDKGNTETLYNIYCGIIISNRPMKNVFKQKQTRTKYQHRKLKIKVNIIFHHTTNVCTCYI